MRVEIVLRRIRGPFPDHPQVLCQTQPEKALALLEVCYERRCSSLATIKVEPDFDVLQREARFQDLVRRLGLSQAGY